MGDPFVENYNLDRSVENFVQNGFALTPPGDYKQKFIDRIEALGLKCPEPRVDIHWACWIFENKETNK